MDDLEMKTLENLVGPEVWGRWQAASKKGREFLQEQHAQLARKVFQNLCSGKWHWHDENAETIEVLPVAEDGSHVIGEIHACSLADRRFSVTYRLSATGSGEKAVFELDFETADECVVTVEGPHALYRLVAVLVKHDLLLKGAGK